MERIESLMQDDAGLMAYMEFKRLRAENADLARQLAKAQAEIERLRAECDRFCDCLMAVSGTLELPHADDGPCDDPRQYERELNGLDDMYRQTEAERVRHSTARFKAESELAALKAAMVKPLEWRQLRDNWFDAEAIGERIEVYRQTTHWVWEYDDGPSDSYKTCDEAKAAAQAHYAARILSALTLPPEKQEWK